jgi:hypothetical protein
MRLQIMGALQIAVEYDETPAGELVGPVDDAMPYCYRCRASRRMIVSFIGFTRRGAAGWPGFPTVVGRCPEGHHIQLGGRDKYPAGPLWWQIGRSVWLLRGWMRRA